MSLSEDRLRAKLGADLDVITKCWSPHAFIYNPIKVGSIDGTDTVAHDRGVRRAQDADYRPNKKVKGKPEATLFVSRLSPTTSEQTLHQVFSKYGSIKRCRLVEDIVTGRSKCYAFIEYDSERSALSAYRRAFGTNLDGQIIVVEMECERLLPGWVPRRLGGGFGGKKESGQLRFGCRYRPFKKPIQLMTEKDLHCDTRAMESNLHSKTSRNSSPFDNNEKPRKRLRS